MASYKNSFSMTEWRIRLEGSGQSSGTPFEKRLLWSVLLLRFISFPHVETNLQRAAGHVSSAAKPISKVLFLYIIIICQEFLDLLLLLLLNKAFNHFYILQSLIFPPYIKYVLVTRTPSGELPSK